MSDTGDSAPRGAFRRRKERRTLWALVATCVVTLAVFVATVIWLDKQALERHEAAFNRQQQLIASIAAKAIEGHFREFALNAGTTVSRVLANAFYGQAGPDQALSDEGIREVLDEHVSTGSLSMLFYDRRTGNVELAVAPEHDVSVVRPLAIQWIRDLFAPLTSSDAAEMVAPIDARPETQYVGTLHEVRFGSEVYGVLVTFVDLAPMMELYVAPLRSGSHGAAFVIDGAGNVVYDHEPSVIGRNVFQDIDPGYPELAKVHRRMVSDPQGTDEYVFTRARDSEPVRMLVAWHAASLGGQTLVVAMSAPEDEVGFVFSELRRQYVAAGLIVALTLVIMSYAFFRARQRDLEDLTGELSDQVQARTAELSSSETKFRGLVEGSIQGIMIRDRDDHVVFANQAFADMHGYDSPDEILALDRPEALVAPDEAATLERYNLERVEKGEVPAQYEYRGMRRDRDTIWLENRLSVVPWDGRPALQSIVVDISERKRAEEGLISANVKLERANLAKSEFLSKMSHELRTPLNAVIGFSETMLQEVLGPIENPRYREYIKDIHSSGTHLLALINDVLDVARLEQGELDLSEEAIDLAMLVDSVARIMSPIARASGVAVEEAVTAGLGQMLADERAVRQILINLCTNAVKFTPRGGHIRILARRDELGAIVVQVADTGVGIPPDRLSEVTQPFVQVHTGPSDQGTGLGLSIVKALTDLHGAVLSIDSTVGEGTTVTIVFPPERSIDEPSRASAG